MHCFTNDSPVFLNKWNTNWAIHIVRLLRTEDEIAHRTLITWVSIRLLYIYIYIYIMVRGSFTQSLGPITWRRHPQSWHWKLGLHRTAQFQRRIWHRVKSCHQHALCWVILQILARSYHAPYHTICMSFSQSGANASKQTELPKMPNSVAEPI